ncbi:phosphatase PAP2 family protein [Actinokineospora enzanensis]|uniref:phosphatase PAP2 family protein n=1 Tax=Actinokineospora enzanensis TaxID=155975 RepID=UPI000373E731|nr:phosphatase PAP2 family protein [Actinokineospora enzanensis]
MTRLMAVGLLLLGAFFLLGAAVSGHTPPAVDEFVARHLGADWQDTTGQVANGISYVLGPVLPGVAALALVVVALLMRGRPGLMSLLLRCVLLLAACRAVSLVKPLFDRQRPRDYPDFSFPSGHVVSVASVAFTGVVLCAWLARRYLRLVVAIAVAAVVVIALCRMLLDVHWLTDVFGGALGVVGVGLLVAPPLRLLPARAPVAATAA